MADRIRYLVTKRGRWHWQPSSELRAAGWTPEMLGDAQPHAQARAVAINALVDEWRKKPQAINVATKTRQHGAGLAVGGAARCDIAPSAKRLTFDWAAQQYLVTKRFLELAPKTRQAYLAVLAKLPATFKAAALSSISPGAIDVIYEQLANPPRGAQGWVQGMVPGLGQQRSGELRVAVVRRVLSFAVRRGWVGSNAAARPELPTSEPRQQVWSVPQILAFIDAADRDGLPSLGDAVMLAVSLSQRQGDVLALIWSQIAGERVELTQSKTRKAVAPTMPSPLRARIRAARARRPTADLGERVIICERTGQPWKTRWFARSFRRVARLAGLPDDLQFLDLRRTGMTLAITGGASTLQTVTMSGHDITHGAAILETYSVRTDKAADAAASALERAWEAQLTPAAARAANSA